MTMRLLRIYISSQSPEGLPYPTFSEGSPSGHDSMKEKTTTSPDKRKSRMPFAGHVAFPLQGYYMLLQGTRLHSVASDHCCLCWLVCRIMCVSLLSCVGWCAHFVAWNMAQSISVYFIITLHTRFQNSVLVWYTQHVSCTMLRHTGPDHTLIWKCKFDKRREDRLVCRFPHWTRRDVCGIVFGSCAQGLH